MLRKQLIWGVLIVCAGVFFLLNREDLLDMAQLWRYWPFIVIAFGINNLIPPTTGKQVMDGAWQILFALWFLASFENWWGLTFRNSWPILIIVAGAGMVLQPVVIKYVDSNKEKAE
ncbi:LiaI-LiaF-like domain-containing protein [Massilia endophytica]|uniref:LiaI-LiaF-like domain-containing protein n=1 Tax=Massilia endophytica TaxID=2899220 RepID=UPI001E62994E|nr:DUF5668 domain-containing protein [Massilia endophytica]UGQ48118.1 DUF5668 domain-containing protein [Massilia endophytica]